MLTVKDLEEFENYMRSGELETDFKDGCENDRYYLGNAFPRWKNSWMWPNWPTRRPPGSSSGAR